MNVSVNPGIASILRATVRKALGRISSMLCIPNFETPSVDYMVAVCKICLIKLHHLRSPGTLSVEICYIWMESLK